MRTLHNGCGVNEPVYAYSPSGKWKVEGYPSDENEQGRVKIFHYKSGAWKLHHSVAGESSGECYGHGLGVAKSGKYVLVGAPHHDGDGMENNGKVYYQAKSKKFDDVSNYPSVVGKTSNDHFGIRMGVSPGKSGKHNVIAAPDFGSDTRGRVYVYKPSSSNKWDPIVTLDGDVSDGVLGHGLFGLHGVAVDEYGTWVGVNAEERGGVDFFRDEVKCNDSCTDENASCEFVSVDIGNAGYLWYQCKCHEDYSSDAIITGDNGTFCRVPTLDETCNPSSVKCEFGYTCDTNFETCRIPNVTEPCLPPVENGAEFGCMAGYLCGDDSLCRLPQLEEVCLGDIGCEVGLVCDGGTCRLPIEEEDCAWEVGCNATYQCDGAHCRKPVEFEDCDGFIGCKTTYQCNSEGKCQKPVEGEGCDNITGCFETFQCDDISLTCRKPTLGDLCDLAVGCYMDYKCGGDLVCRFPEEGESCENEGICSGTYVCDTVSDECRKPIVNEKCVRSIGCDQTYKCGDDGTCRKPIGGEECDQAIMCQDAYICDVTSSICRKPLEEEPCRLDVGCSGTLQCGEADHLCRKPEVGESCEIRPGPGCAEGLVCQNAKCRYPIAGEACLDSPGCSTTLKCTNSICEKPTLADECIVSVGCGATYKCGATGSASGFCRKPIAREACDTTIGCSETYHCNKHGICRFPIENEACSPSIGCEGTLQCEEGTCRLPVNGEACSQAVGCHHNLTCSNGLCRLPLLDEICEDVCSDFLICENNRCRRPIAHEECSTEVGCSETLTCINSFCELPKKAGSACTLDFGCKRPYSCDGEAETCRRPLLDEECTEGLNSSETNSSDILPYVRCMDGYQCRKEASTNAGTPSKSCQHPVREEPCRPSIGCKPRWTCDATNRVCRLPKEGESCTPGGIGPHCKEGLGLHCFGSRPSYICAKMRYAGQPCIVNEMCRGSLGCTNQICKSVSTRNRLRQLQEDDSCTELQFEQALPYGTNQDGHGYGGIYTGEDGAFILKGNAWKALPLTKSYMITRFTRLKFRFVLEEEAEGHAICVDENTNDASYTGSQIRCVALAGSQANAQNDDAGGAILWDDITKLDSVGVAYEDPQGDEVFYDIPLRKLFRYQNTTVDYIALIQDNDEDPTKGNSTFSELELCESQEGQPVAINGSFDVEDVSWEEFTLQDDISSLPFHGLKDRVVKVIKEDIFKANKDNYDSQSSFDHHVHVDGVQKIYWQANQQCYWLRIHYRDGTYSADGDLNHDGTKSGNITLLDYENINKVEIQLSSDETKGMEYIRFSTDENQVYEVEGDGNWDSRPELVHTFTAPHGYILGGIRGLTADEITTIGVYWVQKTEEWDQDGNLIPVGDVLASACTEDVSYCVYLSYSIDGNWKAYVDPDHGPNYTARILRKNGTRWEEPIYYDRESKRASMFSIDVSNDGRAVVGNADSDTGKVTVFNNTVTEFNNGATTTMIGGAHYGEVVRITPTGDYTAIAQPGDTPKVEIRRGPPDHETPVAILTGLAADPFWGSNMEFSDDGKRIVFSSFDYVHMYELRDGNWTQVASNTIDGEGIGSGGVAVNEVASGQTEVYAKETDGTLHAYRAMGKCPCEDEGFENSACLASGSEYQCICKGGYVSASGGTQMIQDGYDVCISSLFSPGTTEEGFTMKVEQETYDVATYKIMDQVQLVRVSKQEDNDIPVNLSEDQVELDEEDGFHLISINGLRPGKTYSTTLLSTGQVPDPMKTAVTRCSCADTIDSNDVTGRPSNFVVSQEGGHVLFHFTDNSHCEEAFSFTRSERGSEEFLRDTSKYGTSFTSDYYFSSTDDCGAYVEPGREASDDLSLSHLTVDKTYTYCVRAVASHYMDHPFETLRSSKLTSSDDACATHRVKWEASIDGKITTKKNAGLVPVQGVKVLWEFEDGQQKPHEGEVITTDGGTFKIPLSLEDSGFSNDGEYPVRIHFSKQSLAANETIQHQFLCNDAEDDCSEGGTEIHLKHLQFQAPLHVYDNTSVPFRGTVYVQGTEHEGHSSGCPLKGAKVCIVDNHGQTSSHEVVVLRDTDVLNPQFTTVCAETDSQGTYSIPAVIGSQVSFAKISYHEHEFDLAPGSKFWNHPILISDGRVYEGMDFTDVTSASMLVEVVGGACNKKLGLSEIQVGLVGCQWTHRFKHTVPRQSYDVPAQIVEVQVTNVWDTRQSDSPGAEDRLDYVMEVFQPADDPLIRTKDLTEVPNEDEAMHDVEEVTTPPDDQDEDAEMEDAKAAQKLVRFQFDGSLEMNVTMVSPSGELSEECRGQINNDQLLEWGINSFDVIDQATLVLFRVTLGYHILDGTELHPPLTCNIVGSEKKLQVVSQIGIDNNKGFEEWLQKQPPSVQEMLEACAPGYQDCILDIQHDKDDNDQPIGNAHVDIQLVTGRPKIAGDHIKTVMFQVLGDDSVEFLSGLFVEGLYEKGPGNSFAIPTHEPIMIIRDPPGGLSYASYENVVTTFKADMHDRETLMHNTFAFKMATITKIETSQCSGLGVAVCTFLAGAESENEHAKYDATIGGLIEKDDETYSHSYSTTWSYATSDDPWLAGIMSDVFVVPNLNVLFQEVTHVYWDKDVCSGSTADKISFALDNPGNDAAVTFYSRWHVISIKIPELEKALNYTQSRVDGMDNGEHICCCNDECTCNCTEADKNDERDRLALLEEGLEGWNVALDTASAGKETKVSIVDWFDVAGYKDRKEGAIEDHPSSISPASLLNGAVCVGCETVQMTVVNCEDCCGSNNTEEIDSPGCIGFFKGKVRDHLNENGAVHGTHDVTDERIEINSARRPSAYDVMVDVEATILPVSMSEEGRHDLSATKRIQFSGGSGTFEMSLKKEKLDEVVSLGKFGNIDHTSHIGGQAIDLAFLTTAGGVRTFLAPIDLTIEHSQKHTKTNSDAEETQVMVVLGDADVGDEFVVDMYADPRYHSLVFDTVAGRSKCPNEYGTLAIEDPSIEFAAFAPQVVMPNDDIVFQVKLANVGVGPSAFRVFTDLRKNVGNLAVKLNGGYLSSPQQYDKLDVNEEVTTTLTISRGPLLYKYPPIDFQLFSACENEGNLGDGNMRDPDATFAFTSVDLWNVIDENGGKYLQFLQPCPSVEWAGDIKRNRGFIVNTKSLLQNKVRVTVFNPNFASRTFKEQLDTETCTDCRLKEVTLRYRKLGTFVWRRARTDNNDVDFAKVGTESSFGYKSLWWDVSFLAEGSYEIMVKSQCDNPGTPDDFNSVTTETFTGVIDKTPPEQFGSSLPLRDLILPGEPMTVVFTEALYCEKPYSFDLLVTVDGSDQTFTRQNNLHVICEDRRIEFAIDPTYVDVRELMGKPFSVELGTDYTVGENAQGEVTDVNDNRLKPNVKFHKTFAKLDVLHGASTTFVFIIEMNCDETTVNNMRDEIREDISAKLGLQSQQERVRLGDIDCVDGVEVTSLVTIGPSAGDTDTGRRLHLRATEEEHSVNLFYALKAESDEIGKSPIRKLMSIEDGKESRIDMENPTLFSVRNMQISPGPKDRAFFEELESNLALKGEEIRREAYSTRTAESYTESVQRGNTTPAFERVLEEVRHLRVAGDGEHDRLRIAVERHERQEKEEHEKLRAAVESQEVLVKEDHEKLRAFVEKREAYEAHEMQEHDELRAFMERREAFEAQEKEEHMKFRALLARQEAQRVMEARCAIIVTATGLAAAVYTFGYGRKHSA